MKFELSRVFPSFRARTQEEAIRVLALTRSERERRDLKEIASKSRWCLKLANSSSQAAEYLRQKPIGVILCDRDLPGPHWREHLTILQLYAPASCFILVSAVNDDYLWEEVIRTGGYDVVTKPFRESQVLRTVTLAWTYWKRYAPTK